MYFLTGLENWGPVVKELGSFFLSGNSFACRWLSSPYVFTWSSLCMVVYIVFRFLLIRTPVILDESPVRGSPFPIASSLRAPSPNMVMFWSTASCGFRGEVGTQFSPWHCQMGDADMNPTLTTTWTTNSTVIPEPMRAKPRGFDWGVSRKPPLRKWYLGWDLKKRWRLNRVRGSSRPGRGNGVCWEMVAPSRALEELKGS